MSIHSRFELASFVRSPRAVQSLRHRCGSNSILRPHRANHQRVEQADISIFGNRQIERPAVLRQWPQGNGALGHVAVDGQKCLQRVTLGSAGEIF